MSWIFGQKRGSEEADPEEQQFSWISGGSDGSWMTGSQDIQESKIKPVTDVDMTYVDADARLTLIFGLRGSGKSLLATVLGGMIKAKAFQIGQVGRLYSNINIDFADVCNPFIYDDIANPTDMRWAKATFVWDEVGEVMMSKRSNSKVVVASESSLVMMRKREIDIIATTQWPHALTGLFAAQCDFFMKPKLHKEYYMQDGNRHVRAAISVDCWNWNGSITGEPMHGRSLMELGEPWKAFTIFGVERFFNKYSTGELVASPHTEYGQAMRERQRARDDLAERIFGNRDSVTMEEFAEKLTERTKGQRKPFTLDEARRYAPQMGFNVTPDGLVTRPHEE